MINSIGNSANTFFSWYLNKRMDEIKKFIQYPVESQNQTLLELIKIGKYYAEESMLFYDADADAYDASKTPQFGENLLYEYYCSLRDEPEKIPDMGSQKLFS